ncbi:MAG TPA: tetratricopeptide repeat protein [Thermoanaerobaculia bacterium]
MAHKAKAKRQMDPGAKAGQARAAAPPRRWALSAAAFVPLVVYWQILGFGFLLDDTVLFQKSDSLSDLASIPRGFLTDLGALRKGAATVISSYYRPVFLALSTLYYQIVAGNPAAWHFASLVLTVAISALVCGLFLRWGLPPLVALLAALVFSLHPAHVSSVAWAAGLQELLAAFFVLLALHAVLSAVRDDGRARPLVLAALAYALALLSKEVAIGLPLFVGLWWLVERKIDTAKARRLLRVTAVLAGITVAYLGVRVAVRGGLATPLEGAPSFAAALPAVPVALATYLRLLLAPIGFSFFRPERPNLAWTGAQVLVALAVLAVATGLAVWAVRRRRELLLPLGWFVVWLLPVLNRWALDPQYMVTDRYLFLPSLALPWAIALLPSRRAPRATVAVLASLALLFAALTVRYTAIFHDERTFVAAMAEEDPSSAFIQAEKGRLLLKDGDTAGARAALTRSVAQNPIGPEALLMLGDLELQQGELDAALGHYRKALVVRPYASRGFKLAALALARAGRRAEAAALADESARRWPDDFEVQLLHSLFLGAAGDHARGQAAFDAARTIRPNDPAVAGGYDAALARLLPTIAPAMGAPTR